MAVGYAHTLLGDFHLAEEAAEDAVLQTYRDLSRLDEPAAFPGWFRKIVFKHCDRFIRKKHIPVVSSDAAIDIPSNTLSPDEQANALCGPLYYFQTYAYPLTIAACYGHIDVVRLLLEYGADPNATYEYNRHDPNEDFIEIGAPLWFAVEKDDHALAELLIESGAEVNTRLHAWYPATLNADGYTSEKMLNLLYRHGATQNIGDYAQSGNIAMVAKLLGEYPEKVLGALGNAAYMKQPDIVEMVLNQYKPELTKEPWFQAPYDAMRESIADRHGVPVMEAIFEYDISPNVRGRENHTLLQRTKIELMRIADEERVSLARCLLERGADIDAKDDELQSTALGWAACYGRKELVTFLLERGAAVNLPDDEPWATPLARAENQGHTDFADLLRSHGATA